MAEQPSIIYQRPTILTTESQWLGSISVNPNHRKPIGIPSNYTKHLITSQEILKKLPKSLLDPFAIVDTQDRIIFIAGTDSDGNDKRYYDIDSLHKTSRPDDSLAEEYSSDYPELLWIRAESYLRYQEFIREKDNDGNDVMSQSLSYKDRDKLALQQLRDREIHKRNWTIKKLVKYMNRYFGVLKDVKWLIAVKTVVIRKIGNKDSNKNSGNNTTHEVPEVTFKLMNPNNFVGAHAIEKLPGDTISIGKLWYEDKNRGQYNGVGFGKDLDDTYLNYWHGLRPIPPNANPTNTKLFFKHIREVLADNDEKLGEYLIKLFAWYIQHPLDRTDVFLVLKGGQGAGKSIVFDLFLGPIYGVYYLNGKMEDLESFNGFLAKKLMLQVEEKSKSRKPGMLDRLKSMVTCPRFLLEEKYMPKAMVDNHINLTATTNADDCAELEHDDRRYLVVKVSDKYKNNSEYFDKLASISYHDVHAALLEVDLTGFNPRNIPKTKIGRQQKLANMSRAMQWWYDTLFRAEDRLFNGASIVSKVITYNLFCTWLDENYKGERYPAQQTFWRDMKCVLGDLFEESNPHTAINRAKSWSVPNIDEAKHYYCLYVCDNMFFDSYLFV